MIEWKRKYRNGLCDAMAIALHRRTGLPLGLVAGVYLDEEGEPALEYCHAVVRLEDGTVLDVDGRWRVSGSALGEARFFNRVKEVRLVEATPDEVAYAFSMEGVSEQQIEDASRLAEADNVLMAEIGRLSAAPAP